MIYDFNIPFTPVAKGRPRFSMRHGFPQALTPEKTRQAERDIRYVLMQQWKNPPLECPIEIHAVFKFKRPKRVKELDRPYPTVGKDLDNLLKLLMDAGNEVLWADDKQVFRCSMAKLYGDTPGTTFTIVTR